MDTNRHRLLLALRDSIRSLVVSLLTFVVAGATAAGDFAIVPGQRIGRAKLEMTREQMREALGKPNATVRLQTGIVREDWLASAFAPKAYVEDGRFFQHDFVTGYFRAGRAVQIEASSGAFQTSDGLSTASGAHRFQGRFPGYQTTYPAHFHNFDPGGCPAAKHFVAYEDAVTKGIAWRYGAWGNLAPDPEPAVLEIVIVHHPGQPVIVDPDGGVRLVWKLPPSQLMEHYPGR